VSTDEPYYAHVSLVAEFEFRYLTELVTKTRGNMSRARAPPCGPHDVVPFDGASRTPSGSRSRLPSSED